GSAVRRVRTGGLADAVDDRAAAAERRGADVELHRAEVLVNSDDGERVVLVVVRQVAEDLVLRRLVDRVAGAADGRAAARGLEDVDAVREKVLEVVRHAEVAVLLWNLVSDQAV